MREQTDNEELTATELEMKRVRTAQEIAERKVKKEHVTLNDLFAKYNI